MNTFSQGKCPFFTNCVGEQCHFAVSKVYSFGYDMDELMKAGYVNNLGVACKLSLALDKIISALNNSFNNIKDKSNEIKKEVKKTKDDSAKDLNPIDVKLKKKNENKRKRGNKGKV
ncbi:MAG: hypothetical protein GF317_04600 [Candidatus Lokiarchaeota archaeon]|nr:hypothetical protein [Candidatus Lokiarchaeota archaeon]